MSVHEPERLRLDPESLRKARSRWANVRNRVTRQLVAQRPMVCHYCGHRLTWVGLPGCVADYHPQCGEYNWRARDHRWRWATVDHVVAMVNGGTNDFDNLVLACQSCNSTKGDS